MIPRELFRRAGEAARLSWAASIGECLGLRPADHRGESEADADARAGRAALKTLMAVKGEDCFGVCDLSTDFGCALGMDVHGKPGPQCPMYEETKP